MTDNSSNGSDDGGTTFVSRGVVLDLLPLYLAGEASADTVALVEQRLKVDDELAAHVAGARSIVLTPVSPPPLQRGDEMRVLVRTRKRIVMQRWLFGFACAFTSI